MGETEVCCSRNFSVATEMVAGLSRPGFWCCDKKKMHGEKKKVSRDRIFFVLTGLAIWCRDRGRLAGRCRDQRAPSA